MSNSNSPSTSTSPSPHILVFPYPAQGHMLPLLDLTHQLAIRGLTITLLITPKNLPILNPLLTLHPSIHTLILPFPNHPSSYIPPGIENVKDLPSIYFRPMMRVLGELYNPLLQWFQSHSSPPVAILSDFFLGWTWHLANQLGIPRIIFSPSAALALQILHCLFQELPKPPSPDKNSLIRLSTIPNSPAYPWWQLSPLFRSYKQDDPEAEFMRDCFLVNSASWGIVINSFDELESEYLDHLRSTSQHVWAVGPLLPPDVSQLQSSSDSGSGGVGSIDNVMSWLDTCPNSSVVYVCFGSLAVLNNKQMEGLAIALGRSDTRFVWCVKEPTGGHTVGEYGKVPDGFEQQVARTGKGRVIRGWVPQVLILRHQAVGAFMTHCGWNSVLESLIAGVPLLMWPMSADQFVNATLLVDQLGVAVRVCEGSETVPNATELALALVESVSSEALKRRTRVMELQKAAMRSVKQGGKSFKNLDDFVEALWQIPF